MNQQVGEPNNPATGATQQRQPCVACGSHLATEWSTSDGKAWLCRECATLDGLGCP